MRSARILALISAFLGPACARAGFLTDFSNSYAQYQAEMDSASDFDGDRDVDGADFLIWQRGVGRTNQTNKSTGDANVDRVVSALDFGLWKNQFTNPPVGIPDGVAFKLYFDPAGINEGRVTVVVDAPHVAGVRFAVGPENGLFLTDPRYDFDVIQNVTTDLTRDRFEAKVHFTIKSNQDVPDGPVTIFGYQVFDRTPQEPVAEILPSFQFNPGDSIVIRNADNSFTQFLDNQLADVPMTLTAPLAINVNTASGQVIIHNISANPVSISSYEILSAAGSLDFSQWGSIDESEADPPNMGWVEAPDTNEHRIAETKLDAPLTLVSDQRIFLGRPFDVVNMAVHDLVFNYVTPDGLCFGEVRYFAGAPITAVPEPGAGALLAVGAISVARFPWRRRGK